MAVIAIGRGDALHESQLTRRFAGLEEMKLGQLGGDHVARPTVRYGLIGADGALEFAPATRFDTIYKEAFTLAQIRQAPARALQHRIRPERLRRRLCVDVDGGRIGLDHGAIRKGRRALEYRSRIRAEA